MRPSLLLYRGAQGLARALTPLARGRGKVSRGLRGRRDAHHALVAWGRGHRAAARPLAWFHAPSVGEGLQARAVVEALRAARPDVQVVFTHFSPSAERLAAGMPADVAGYLPWDLPGTVDPVLDAVRPDVIAFTKTEVWPVLVARAAARGVPCALVAATLPEGSGRAGWAARRFLGPTWRSLSMVAAIADDDARRFEGLGARPAAVHVTGDPGIDSAAHRAEVADPAAPWLAPFHAAPRPTVVAGSTWPADDRVLLPALDAVRRAHPDLRAVLAAHEPEARHVAAQVADLRTRGWSAATLADVERDGAGGVDAVVVDRVGVLAALYTVGTVAYVGGGFHDQGLHSVLEPAAAGLPVCFGPRHANSRAASELLAEEVAAEAAGAPELARILQRWLGDTTARGYAASRARDYIHAHRGAAVRTAALLDPLLSPDTPAGRS